MATPNSEKRCSTCNKGNDELTSPLKVCAKCKIVQYCSQDCQKADWKVHKRACTTTSSGGAPATPRQRFLIERPFTALRDGHWLSSRPEQDVYQLMSDVFRMRREDQYKFEGVVEEGSVYAGGSALTELKNHRKFLKSITKLDEERAPDKRLLPSWWSAEKLEECVESDIQEYYNQLDMPMQLRMFGEALDGTKTMGQSGASMLRVRVAVETGGLNATHVDMA